MLENLNRCIAYGASIEGRDDAGLHLFSYEQNDYDHILAQMDGPNIVEGPGGRYQRQSIIDRKQEGCTVGLEDLKPGQTTRRTIGGVVVTIRANNQVGVTFNGRKAE